MDAIGTELVAQFEALCQQFYETSDSAVRSQAEKRLMELTNGSDCLQTCRLIIEHAKSSYALAIAVNAMTQAIEKTDVLVTLSVEQRSAMRTFLLSQVGSQADRSAYVLSAFGKALSVLARVGWFDHVDGTFVQQRMVLDLCESAALWRWDQSNQDDSAWPSIGHVSAVLGLLTQVVTEMGTFREQDACYSRSATAYRRVNASFRDVALLQTFTLATRLLRGAAANLERLVNAQLSTLVECSLRLALACLTYDFCGAFIDDPTNAEVHVVHVSTTWRPQIVDGTLVTVAYRLYASMPDCSLALDVLVQLSAVRRSLFTAAERHNYVCLLLDGAARLLDESRLLARPADHHSFCRLLARLAFNFPLAELVRCYSYAAFAPLVGRFTISSLHATDDAASPNAIFYLLAFWRRLVAGIPYLENGEPHLLTDIVREIVLTLILSRANTLTAFVRRADRTQADHPLDDQTTLLQQLEQVACIARFDYSSLAPALIQLIDVQLSRFHAVACCDVDAGVDPLDRWNTLDCVEIELVFCQLTWLVYVGGAFIGSRVSFTSTDLHDRLDADIVCRVLKMITQSDSLLRLCTTFVHSASVTPNASLHDAYWRFAERLDLALLFFIEQLRRTYIGEQVLRAAMYAHLVENTALRDETMLLAVLFDKLVTNLRCWPRSENIVAATVELLNELCSTQGVTRRLCKLDTVQLLLNNHAQVQLAILANLNGSTNTGAPRARANCRVHGAQFSRCQLIETQLKSLSLKSDTAAMTGTDVLMQTQTGTTCTCKQPSTASIYKYRTLFYSALGRLLLADSREDEQDRVDKFERFMRPFQCVLADIQSKLHGSEVPPNDEAFDRHLIAPCAGAICGLAMDLRGLLLAFTDRESFLSLFAAVHPFFTDLLLQTIDCWFASQPQLVITGLRFFAELAHNRLRRIQFHASSPNGCLLFRDLCRIICLVGAKLERLECSSLTRATYYALKPKAVAICFTMLRAALIGRYANFGVMRFYGDLSFELATQSAFRMVLITSTRDLNDYPKLRTAFYELLECISREFVHCLTNLDQNVLAYVLETVATGISNVDPDVCATCCNILDCLLTYAYSTLRCKANQRNAHDSLLALVLKQPDVFERCLAQLIDIVIRDESGNRPYVTRPLLVLILLFEQSFASVRTQIVHSVPHGREQLLEGLFSMLMRDVESNLSTQNRDRFAQNVTACKQQLAEWAGVRGGVGLLPLFSTTEADYDPF